MFYSSSRMRSVEASTRVGTSPAYAAHKCVMSGTETAIWHTAYCATCSCCAAFGTNRALTAPTLTSKAAAVFTKEPLVFPEAPSLVQCRSTSRANATPNDFVAADAVEVSLNLPKCQNITHFMIGGFTSSAGAIQTAFPAAGVALSTVGDCRAGGVALHKGSSPISLSRRGLSVHAAPFQPRSATDLSLLSSTLDLTEIVDVRPLCEGQHCNRNGEIKDFPVEQRKNRPPAIEFPRTPLAEETVCMRLSTPVGTSSSASVARPLLTTSIVGGDSRQWMVPLAPLSPSCSTQQQLQQQRSVHYGAPGCSTSSLGIVCPQDTKDGNFFDYIRHRRVPFTDAEAMDEDTMLDLLRGSSSDDNDDEEDHVVYMEQQQQHVLDLATVLPASLGLCNCAGGYWDLEGPRAATRRFLRRGTPSTASLSLTAQGGSGSPACVTGNDRTTELGVAGFNNGHEDDELWEMNSSAYADSLDEEQLEWIEHQLHAKENPEGFFF